MSKIVGVFLPQGFIIGELVGDVTETKSDFEPEKAVIKVKNPALVITRQTEVVLAPFLQLVEEQEVRVDVADIAFKQIFTPKKELVNHYNQIYGSGLVITDVLPL
jgi:hypothetical protein